MKYNFSTQTPYRKLFSHNLTLGIKEIKIEKEVGL
jgi:hypothetical protein